MNMTTNEVTNEAIGVYCLTAFGRIEVLDFEYGVTDKVVWRWNDDKRLHKTKVYYGKNGNYFIASGFGEIYLDDIVIF